MAELYDKKQFEFHTKEAKRRFPGPKYLKVLEWIHSTVHPNLYVEIGVCMGDSLKLVPASTQAIGIDPTPKCTSKKNARIFAMPSDEFFAQVSSGDIPDVNHISLSFIDGLHTYDQALRDFAHLETLSDPNSVILFHDCIPLDEATNANPRQAQFYTGDVWKTLLILMRTRPDLHIAVVPAWPSGLAIVTHLNPDAKEFREDLPKVIEEYRPLGFDKYSAISHELPPLIPVEPTAVRQFLDS
jgi:predicted O-methyltransferase YrrM